MKIVLLKENLLKNIQKAQNIINVKVNLPILLNVLLESEKDKLKITTTDLDIGMLLVCSADVLEDGAITLPAKKFGEIIRDLPNGNITITTQKNNMVIIEAQKCQFKIMGLPKDEFPKLPEIKNKIVIKMNQGVFKQMLNLTYFAVSYDTTRYILNGVLMDIGSNLIKMVATDGRRLSIIENKINVDINNIIRVIIPIKTVQELMRNLEDEGELSIVFGVNQIMFDLSHYNISRIQLDELWIISRLIEGEFPGYQQVIPQPVDNKIKINKDDFMFALKRTSLLSTLDYQAAKLEIFKNRMVISKTTPDVGECREEIDIDYKGRELMVGFNPDYLMDVLRQLKNEDVLLELSDSEKPCVIRENNYTYIALPMKL
ncbi:MAG: DNA polymerase III subunit beta [Candidatus Omnitrophota bacterium]